VFCIELRVAGVNNLVKREITFINLIW